MNEEMPRKDRFYDIIIRDMEEANLKPIIRDVQRLSTEKCYIRLWKLGNLEHKLYATQAAFAKFQEILKQWDGKSDLDILWGPDLEVQVIEC